MITVCGLFHVMVRAGWNIVDVEIDEMRGSVTREDLNPRFDHSLQLCYLNNPKTHLQFKDSEPYSTGNNFSLVAF